MKTVCYVLIFIFEQIVSFMYFNNKFYLKKTKSSLFIAYFLSFAIQFSGNILGTKTGFSELNLITFFVCNLIIVLLFFESTIKQAVFNVIILEGLMITSELGVMYLTSLLLNIDLQEYLNDNTVILLETIGTKTLYFMLAFFISKLSTKEKAHRIKANDISFLLFILPLSSIGIIISFTYLSIKYDTDYSSKLVFTVISLILLFANIIVFIVHEAMLKTLYINTELQLEAQKKTINEEYYKDIQKQYDSSNLLIHDIKKCLMNIRGFAAKNDSEAIVKYVDSIYQGYSVNSLKQFSGNKLVNVIVSRYNELCSGKNIDFQADIRNVDFSFISDSDLTALLDNLLENAYEASCNSANKHISLLVESRNETFVLFEIKNSCDDNPNIENKGFETTKQDKTHHGIGLKSVSKIVKNHYGNIDFNYDEENKSFIVTVLLNTLK